MTFYRLDNYNPADFAITFDESEGKTKQEFASEADINQLIARFTKTGVMPNVRASIGQYMDVTNILTEYDDRLKFIMDVQDAFDALPAIDRKSFDNDPARWLESVAQQVQAEEAAKLAPQPSDTPAEPLGALGEGSGKGGGTPPA